MVVFCCQASDKDRAHESLEVSAKQEQDSFEGNDELEVKHEESKGDILFCGWTGIFKMCVYSSFDVSIGMWMFLHGLYDPWKVHEVKT